MSNETTVGQIVGYLRMDASQWNEEIDSAEVKADGLSRKNPKISITTNAAEAIAQIDAVALAEKRLSDASERVKNAQGNLLSAGGGKEFAQATHAVSQALREEKDAADALGRAQAKAAADADKMSTATRVSAATAKRSLLDLLDASRAAAGGQDRLSESTKKAADSSKKADDANKKQSQGLGILVTAIAALGPAIVPVAVGATGLAAGFSAMGAAGILALVGIKQEMAQGTAVGRTYTAQVNVLEGDLHVLARTAATGVLAPFESNVKSLQREMPTLTGMVGEFSVITGKTAGNLVTGLGAAFVALEPLMRDTAVYTFGLSQRFDQLMTGPGVVSFGDYVRSVFPQVMATVESLVGAVIHLVAAFAPLGLGVLSEIKLLSDLIGAIPVDVLSVLATVATSAFLGFKSFSTINGMVDGLGKGLRALGVSAEAAAAGMQMATIAAGVIGAAVTIVTFLFAQSAEATRQNQQAVNDYTDALRASNGVINESIRAKAAQILADNGTLQLARDLHVSLMDVTSAALGQKDAIGWVNAALDKQQAAMRGQVNASGAAGQAYDVFNGKAADLRKQIGANNTSFQEGLQKFRDTKDATQGATAAITAQNTAQVGLAASLGTTVGALQAAQTAQQQTATQTAAATTQMQLQNDAAGLLKQALDALNGKAITAADAQNAFDASLVNMGNHVTAAGSKVKNTSHSINDMTAGSVALRGELNAQVKNLQNVVEANGGLQGSTAKSRAQMATLRQEIINNAVAHGVNRQAVTNYIDKLLAIPKKIPPTKLDVDTAAAMVKIGAMRAAINSITGKTVSVYTDNYITTHAGAVGNAAQTANQYALGNVYTTSSHNVATGQKPVARAGGGDVPGYAGGTLIGPGSGMSDSIMAMVAQTGQLLRVSTGEFLSSSASRSRNRAALEAGNRGAQLEVAGKGRPVQHFHIQPTDPYLVAHEIARLDAFAAV